MHSRVFLRAPILFLSSPPSSASMLRGRDFLHGPGSLGRKSAVAGAVASSFIGMGRDKGLVAIFFLLHYLSVASDSCHASPENHIWQRVSSSLLVEKSGHLISKTARRWIAHDGALRAAA
ncbi:hypothetical protein IWZ00DRAFT_72156 [Phyllosticta capitalensis]